MSRGGDSKNPDALFAQALELEGPARDVFIDEACAGDSALRGLLMRLLAASEAGEGDGWLPPGGGRLCVKRPPAEPPSELHADLPAGARVGLFRIVRCVGRGGMAAVYLAERADGSFEQEVAVKVMDRAGYADDVAARFEQERQILASLNHPHIARLIDGGATLSGDPYVAMEYIEGEPVDTYCDRYRLPIRRRLEIFVQIAEAVDYAHRNLVVHRDIKPSNILVGLDGRPKLLDFGIAKLLDRNALPHAAPETHGAVHPMTPEYASPEQVSGRRLSTASDVYQLGFLLYRLLIGCSPYELKPGNYRDLVRAICDADPTLPSQTRIFHEVEAARALGRSRSVAPERLRRQLRGDLDAIVSTALRKEPERRYASARTLAEDIARYLEGRPVAARKGRLSYRAGKFVRRNAWPLVAAGLVLASLVTGAVVAIIQARRATTEALRAEEVAAFVVRFLEASDPDVAPERAVTVRSVMDRALARIDSDLRSEPLLQARLRALIGRLYHRLGVFDVAEEQLRLAVALQEAQLGSEHPDVADTRDRLAAALVSQMRFREAEEHAGRALEIRGRIHGPRSSEVAQSLTTLASARLGHGAIEAARASLLEGLAIVEGKKPNADGPEEAPVIGLLARVETEAGQLEEAERYARRALHLRLDAEGESSIWTARARYQLASVLLARGRAEDAHKHIDAALKTATAVLGADHPWVYELNGVSQIHRGNYAEAFAAHERARQRALDMHGPEHPVIASVLNGLGTVRFFEGRYRDAADYFGRSLELRARLLDPGHPLIALTRSSLARAWHRADDARAEAAYLRALEELKESRGPEHPAVAEVLNDFGRFLVDADRPAEAERPLQEALRIRQAAFGEDDARVTTTKLNLAACLSGLGRHEEAEPLFWVAAAWRAHDGGGPLDIAEVDLLHADALARQEKFAEAKARFDAAHGAIRAAEPTARWLSSRADRIRNRVYAR